MQNVVIRSWCDLKIPRPVCDPLTVVCQRLKRPLPLPRALLGTTGPMGSRSTWADSLYYTLGQEETCLAPEMLKSWRIEGYLGKDNKTSRRHIAPKSRETTESSARDWTLTLKETTPHLRQVDPEEFPQPDRHLDPHSNCPALAIRQLVNATSQVFSA